MAQLGFELGAQILHRDAPGHAQTAGNEGFGPVHDGCAPDGGAVDGVEGGELAVDLRVSDEDVVDIASDASHDLDLPVVLVAPHVFNGRVGARLFRMDDVVGHAGGLFHRVSPVLGPDVLAVLLVAPAGYVADGVHVRSVEGLTVLVEHDPVVHQQAGCAKPGVIGDDANTDQHGGRLNALTVGQVEGEVALLAFDSFHSGAEHGVDPVVLVKVCEPLADLRVKEAAHGHGHRVDDGDLQSQAAGGGCRFGADEPCPDNGQRPTPEKVPT